MKQIKKSTIVNYSQQQMFDLVADVEKYPQFLPWCGGSTILQTLDLGVVAEVKMHLGAFSKSFTTANQHQPHEKIIMRLVKGPFSKLYGEWNFEFIAPNKCKVSVDIKFDFDNLALSLLVSPIFSKITSSMIDSFVARAKQVYN